MKKENKITRKDDKSHEIDKMVKLLMSQDAALTLLAATAHAEANYTEEASADA